MVKDYFDIGIYSISDAARLTKTNKRRIRNWLQGYNQKKRLTGQLPKIDNSLALGFLDLLEIRFINHFRNYGIKMKTLYLAADKARELFNSDHPFATKFITDGVDIFIQTNNEISDPKLESLVNKQFAMYETLKNLIQEGIEFNKEGRAVRWFPNKDNQNIVIDPQRSFGQPILNEYGIPTSAIYDAFKVEKDVNTVAEWYNLEVGDVISAIEFEDKFAA